MNDYDLARIVILVIIQASGCGLMFLILVHFKDEYKLISDQVLEFKLHDSRFPLKIWGEFWIKKALWFIVALAFICIPINYY